MLNKSDLLKFDPAVYTKIILNDLVVFSIYYLHNKNADVASEDIVSACFMLFPKRFSLKNHPRWPDSAMVGRHWSVCRSKGYIAANDPGFKLTAKGVRIAEKVAKILGMEISKRTTKIVKPAAVKKAHVVMQTKKAKIISPAPIKKTRPVRVDKAPLAKKRKITPIKNVRPIWVEKTKPPEPVVRSVVVEKAIQSAQSNATREAKIRAGRFVRAMETSDAYILYRKNGKSSKISEFDFRSLLLCTMESSPETLARNVEQFKGYAGIHNRHDIAAFLDFCEEKFLYLLSPQTKQKQRSVYKRKVI